MADMTVLIVKGLFFTVRRLTLVTTKAVLAPVSPAEILLFV